MKNNFFQFLLASCLGTLLAAGGIFVLFWIIILSMGGDNKPDISDKSVLKLDFSNVLPELTNNTPADGFSFELETDDVVGLRDMTRIIAAAAEDDEIEGILIEAGTPTMMPATSSVLRQAIEDFKASGKFVYAYADNYTQNGYYLSSAADSVFISPMGSLDFKGLAAQLLYFKNMLDNVGVTMQVVYAGQFKSATEPLRRTDMSEQNRLQTRAFLEKMYDVLLEDISASRGIAVAELDDLANNYRVRSADDAVRYGLADATLYRDELIDLIKSNAGLDDDDKLRLVDAQTYYETIGSGYKAKSDGKIAVVYAEGAIVDGEGDIGGIGGENYARIFRKLRKDEKVDAVVLRVNSGGGSALASEIMWRELDLLRQQKPLIVSMGDLAASGGYYIACLGDTILAEQNTITGSIGVFGVIPVMNELLTDKMGITVDTVKTGKFATGLSPFYAMNEEERAIVQEGVDSIYQLFLRRVAEGRDMSVADVHEIAQGRVWTGEAATGIGLVDAIGGLDEAIAMAARRIGIEDYAIAQYPRVKKPIDELISQLTGAEDEKPQVSLNVSRLLLKEQLGEFYPIYEQMQRARDMKGIQMRLPFELTIE